MSKMPKYFMYFPGNYRWSAAFVNMLGRGSFGGAEISELHKIGRLLEGKAPKTTRPGSMPGKKARKATAPQSMPKRQIRPATGSRLRPSTCVPATTSRWQSDFVHQRTDAALEAFRTLYRSTSTVL